VLVHWILETSKNGYSLRKYQLLQIAKDIHQQHVSKINDTLMIFVEYSPIGEQWADRFIQRHSSLKNAFARLIDAARIKETTTNVLL
jgi:hypothetical protein